MGRGWWVVVALAAFGLLLLADPAWAQAQDEPVKTETLSFLKWAAKASGPIGLIILLMSFYLAALVIQMALEFRASVAVPERLARSLADLIAQKRYTDAFNRLESESGSFLGRVLSAGVRKLPSGFPAAQRAMELVNEDVTMEMEHKTTYLATVGTLGPMIGLVGTVYGMILSFQAMAASGSTPDAAKLAEGIGTALFATLEGIAIAIPAIAFHAFFRNRIARLSLEVELAAEPLLEQFAPGIRAPHPLATMNQPGVARTALPRD